jgi:putative Mn2+ efflux pump MntP
VSLVFAAFEGATPAVGLVFGGLLGHAIGQVADYLAGGLLIAYAAYALFRTEDLDEIDAAERLATTHGWALVLISLSVSLDELAVGFTLGLSRVPVVPALVLVAAQAFVVSQLGIRFGGRLSARFGHQTERTAGMVLGLLGVGLLLQQALR